MKLLNSIVCLNSRISLIVIAIVLCSTLVLASVMVNTDIPKSTILEVDSKKEPWTPTDEDIAFQDSMYAIIERTQLDLDTIRAGIDRILYKLERFDYPDGSYDSIRYVVGSKIDKRRNKN